MSPVIEATGLIKTYGRTRALDGLDLRVDEGEVHGFLGPNGAGKSTTIRLVLGLARPSSGSLTVLGRDPWADAVDLHRRIASVPGDVNLWPNITGGEAVDLLARLRGAEKNGSSYRSRRAELMDAFEFDPTKKGRTYSKGNRQKVALIAALAVPADLYVLDEPTSGLDPLMEAQFGREIVRLTAQGATVLLSSHSLSEVEELCGRVSIVRSGRTVETGTLAELRHLTRSEVSFTADTATIPDAVRHALPNARDMRVDGNRVRFAVEQADLASVLAQLGTLPVTGLTIAPPTLEELFLRHYDEPAVTR